MKYYRTSNGEVVELEQQERLYLWSEDIIEIIIPDGCKVVNCENNQLKKILK